MKITDLLSLDVYWLQGYNTRITADNNCGTTETNFSVFGKYGDRYTIVLYDGNNEDLAVEAFLKNEKND